MDQQFWFGLLLGMVAGLLLGLIIMHLGFISAARATMNKPEDEEKDDWWKKGEPAPWEREWDDE